MKMSSRKIGILVVIGVIWIALLYDTFNIPDVAYLARENPATTAFMDDHLLSNRGPFSYEWEPLEKISPYLPRAVIAAEDDLFFEHEGFNWKATIDAAKYDWKKKKFVRGGSTLTQQLARNLFLSKSKNPFRKLKEFLIALKLERQLSKERILELYLNVAEWGPGVYGAEAASHYYFKHPAARLSPSESAFLASILPNPKKMGKGGFRMTRRASTILRRM
jgi:monofunctional biosynthetic peptidoglycan transglycosylase